MRRKQEKEINIFSISTIDLLTSTVAVFMILAVVAVPRMKSKIEQNTLKTIAEVESLIKAVESLTEVESSYLQQINKKQNDISDIDSKIQDLAKINQASLTKVQNVARVAETLKASQKIIEDLVNKLKSVKKDELDLAKNLQGERVKTFELKKSLLELKDEIKKKENYEKPSSDRFVAVLLRWDTPQHDLDLQIKDPDGELHSYKSNNKQTILSDSTRGPGAEIWYLQNPKPGKYQIQAYFHGRYGNKDNPRLRVTVVDSRNIQIVPELELEREGQVSDVGNFDISDKKYLKQIRTPAGVISVPDPN